MNIEQLEKILRNPPAIKTPPGLSEKLTAEIDLPRVRLEREEWVAPTPWFKHWLPALSFITIFLVCLVAIAVQTNLISDLRRSNEKLRSGQGDLDALRAQNAQVQKLRIQNQELDRLRKDSVELQQLRDEVARLGPQVSNLAALRAENARLHALVSPNATSTNQDGDFFAEAQAKAERIACVNNLKQIGLAARIWAGDNNDVFPSNFICMTNELVNPIILRCPSDKSRVVADWNDVAKGNVSYTMDAAGLPGNTNPQVIFAECPIHHNVCLMDGSVQQLSPKAYQENIKVVDGLKILQWK